MSYSKSTALLTTILLTGCVTLDRHDRCGVFTNLDMERCIGEVKPYRGSPKQYAHTPDASRAACVDSMQSECYREVWIE